MVLPVLGGGFEVSCTDRDGPYLGVSLCVRRCGSFRCAACCVRPRRSRRLILAVIPDTPNLPWSDPGHQSAFELLASGVASQIVGRDVYVHCHGRRDWSSLTAATMSPEIEWGFIPSVPDVGGLFVSSSPGMELSPVACEHLWRYAKAVRKPTTCVASKTRTATTTVTVRRRVRIDLPVAKRVRVDGRLVTRTQVVRKWVWRSWKETRTATRTVRVGRVPCYRPAVASGVSVASPAVGSREYFNYVFAIETLAHESIHLLDLTAGKSIQPVATPATVGVSGRLPRDADHPRVAVALGASADDAESMTRYFLERVYPLRKAENPDYWSPDCKANGPLDQTPDDGVWP